MRILLVDIETEPTKAYVWSLWKQNIGLNQIVQSGGMMCWAAKWFKDPQIEFRSIHHDGREKMIQRIWDLLDEADCVVHYNGKKFDIPHINATFLEQNLKPPSPYFQVDLITTIRRDFKFLSNKLEYISRKLKIGEKIEHEGFELWVKCIANDKVAWSKMKQYNIGDVKLTERLYKKLLPWIRSHANYGAIDEKREACPNCGSRHIQSRGNAYTRTGKYMRFQCQACGKWLRGTHSTWRTDVT